MDKELAELAAQQVLIEKRMRLLRFERNKLSPVSRLPAEVLSEIFVWRASPTEKPRMWVPSITHVCASWREIALNFPPLWSTIHGPAQNMGPSWLATFLERSKGAPLSIHSQIDDFPNQDEAAISRVRHILANTLKETHRLRHVFLSGDLSLPWRRNGISAFLVYRMTSPAPLLTKITVHNSLSYRRGIVLPSPFLAGHAPCLKEATFSDCLPTNLASFPISPIWNSASAKNSIRVSTPTLEMFLLPSMNFGTSRS
ncbi:hypothetical protein CC2G_008608 [Coprinopsis cinerea AmutBmut pab1-1]|nr:hypothetical protein CC2G_008608 [Coprinopsis cinerea AmutBmut pab1-1]